MSAARATDGVMGQGTNMTTTVRRVSLGATLAVAFLASMPARAGVVAVVNPSFEILPPGGLPIACGLGCSYSFGPAPGWSGGGGGQLKPGVLSGNTTLFNYLPDGATVAYTNGGALSQTVAATAVAGRSYTLKVDVGFRKDDFADVDMVALVVGGHTIYASGATLQSSGDWATWTAGYTATAADAGAPITIVLDTLNGPQGNFDNVRLTTGVPEASAWTLMLFGVGALGFASRRRRAFALA